MGALVLVEQLHVSVEVGVDLWGYDLSSVNNALSFLDNALRSVHLQVFLTSEFRIRGAVSDHVGCKTDV